MGLELLAQPESPAEFRRSLDKTKVDFSRMAGNRTEKPIANCVKAITLLSRGGGPVYAWTHVLGAIATT